MQSVSSRIWTRVAVSISYDDNHYTTGTSFKFSFTPTCVHSNLAYLPLNINVSEFVSVSRETMKKSLEHNHDGSNKLLERSENFS